MVNNSIYEVDIRTDCLDLPSAERKLLFAVATARANGVHLVKAMHTAAQGARLRRALRAWRDQRLISVFIGGGELASDHLTSTYLSEMYPAVCEDADFRDGSPEVTFLAL